MKNKRTLLIFLSLLLVSLGWVVNGAIPNGQSVGTDNSDSEPFQDPVFLKELQKRGIPLTSGGKIDVKDQNTLNLLNSIKVLEIAYEEDIKSVRGLEYLTGLERLYLPYSEIKSIDLSNNTELQELRLYAGNLDCLDVSKNLKLTLLYATYLNIKELDLSKNINLEKLFLGSTYSPSDKAFIGDLILPEGSRLSEIYASYTQLKRLDVSRQKYLKWLYLRGCKLTSLDVSGLSNLEILICDDNQLEQLDVSGLTKLHRLYCKNNRLKEILFFNNRSLDDLECDNNYLDGMDVSGIPEERLLFFVFSPQYGSDGYVKETCFIRRDGNEIDGTSFVRKEDD